MGCFSAPTVVATLREGPLVAPERHVRSFRRAAIARDLTPAIACLALIAEQQNQHGIAKE